MPDGIDRPTVQRPFLSDETLAGSVDMFCALFTALDWIESGQVNASERQIMNARAGLILAGKQLTEELGERQ